MNELRKELTYRLYEKYPKIFEYRTFPHLMAFGFECGDGWFWLIDKLCDFYKKINEQTGARVVANQVKEKFGELCFYIGISDCPDLWTFERIKRMTHFILSLSRMTCEVCGEMGEWFNDDGWYKTRCMIHR